MKTCGQVVCLVFFLLVQIMVSKGGNSFYNYGWLWLGKSE